MWAPSLAVGVLAVTAHVGGIWTTGMVLCVGGMVMCAVQLFIQNYRRPNEPPLFGGLVPYMGHALSFGKDYAALLTELASKAGDAPAFTAYIAGQRMTFIKSPHDFPSILKESKRLEFRPIGAQAMKDAFGMRINPAGDAYNEWDSKGGVQWAMMRGSKLPPLLGRMWSEVSGALDAQERAFRITADWVEIPDLYELVTNIIWQATAHAVFGNSLGTDAATLARSKDAFNAFDQHFPLLLAGVPSSVLSKCDESMQYIRDRFMGPDADVEEASEVIKFRQEWLTSERAAELGFTEHELGTFQLTMVWAAFANTIPSAFWALFCMLKDGSTGACIREAQAAHGAAKGDDEALGSELASGLPVITSVVSEALRLCIGSLTVRKAVESFELKLKGTGSSVHVRAGDRIVLAPVMTHMDKTIYPDPSVFRRERFDKSEDDMETKDEPNTQEPSHKTLPPSVALQPFGGGVSMCPGRFLAMGEVKAFVAQIAMRWEIELMPVGEDKNEIGEGHMRLDGHGVPRLNMARAGLGSLPPVDRVPCRVRRRACH